jgi:uncharacterized cupin superfamily protein
VIAGQPLNCPSAGTAPGKDSGEVSDKEIVLPQFESDQTRVQLVRVLPHRRVEVGHSSRFELIVALDHGSLSPAPGERFNRDLKPGDFMWFDKGGPSRTLLNNGDEKARYVEISFSSAD